MKIGEIAASNVNRTSMVTNSELEKDCKPVDNGEINKSEVDADVKLATASTKKKDSYGINVTDAKNSEQIYRFQNILTSMGVFEALEQAGAKDGNIIKISHLEFSYFA